MRSKHQHMGEKAEVGNCSILQQQNVPSPQQSLWCTGWVVCMSAARLWSRSSWSCHIKKVGLPPSFFGLISSSVWITVSFLCSYLDLLSSSPRVFSASAILWEKSLLPTALYPLSFQKKNKTKQNTKKTKKTPKNTKTMLLGWTEGRAQLCLELDNVSLPFSTRVPACRQTAAKQSAQLCVLHPFHPSGCYCKSCSDISILWQNFIWVINSFYKVYRNQLADSI